MTAAAATPEAWNSQVLITLIVQVGGIVALILNNRWNRSKTETRVQELTTEQTKTIKADTGQAVEKLEEVHTIVNGERTKLQNRVAQLENELARIRGVSPPGGFS